MDKIIKPEEAEAAIEAMLFTVGSAVALDDLAECIGHDTDTTSKLVHHLMDRYRQEQRGIRIIELDGAFQMCTAPEMYEYVIALTHRQPKQVLTDALLETLAVIAYRQPVTRAEIEQIRGVSCSHAINRLEEYGLICEKGRLSAPGRPILFGTTQDFLRAFGVKSTDSLPSLTPEEEDILKTESEEEVQMRLDV